MRACQQPGPGWKRGPEVADGRGRASRCGCNACRVGGCVADIESYHDDEQAMIEFFTKNLENIQIENAITAAVWERQKEKVDDSGCLLSREERIQRRGNGQHDGHGRYSNACGSARLGPRHTPNTCSGV